MTIETTASLIASAIAFVVIAIRIRRDIADRKAAEREMKEYLERKAIEEERKKNPLAAAVADCVADVISSAIVEGFKGIGSLEDDSDTVK